MGDIMGAELNIQSYWQQASYYLAAIVFSLLALYWAIVCALADPERKAKLRKIAVADALFFAFIPFVFYLLAPYAGSIMSAVGTAATHFRGFVSLIHISIGLGLACYLFVVGAVYLRHPEEGHP
jgi:uncharacterized membrane protein (DUF485 family)